MSTIFKIQGERLLECSFAILPLILTLFFYKLQTLGKNKLYCWVKQPTNFNSTFYVQVSVYIIRWVNIFVVIVYTIKILRFFYSHKGENKEETKVKYNRILNELGKLQLEVK